MYISKYFQIQELVDSDTFKKYGSNAWSLFSSDYIITIDKIKEVLGYEMICNTWNSPKYLKLLGPRTSEGRGFRDENCTIGSKTGAHYKGLAGDFNFLNGNTIINPKIIIDKIIKNRKSFPNLAGLETGCGWNHIDCMSERFSNRRRGIKNGKIILFNATGTDIRVI